MIQRSKKSKDKDQKIHISKSPRYGRILFQPFRIKKKNKTKQNKIFFKEETFK